MSIHTWFRLPRVRRGLAVSMVVLATGGLVLSRTPASAGTPGTPDTHVALAGGSNAATWSGPGVHGRFALSHTTVLARGEQRIYAELDLKADPAERRVERAPLALAVVLDTSGSMGGEKIDRAKDSVVRLIREMRDDDQIAFVRYASDTELVQPLARVGSVREALIARVQRIQAEGGTNIPPALRQGLDALAEAGKGRVRRVVLASDGLDASRALSEQIARDSTNRGITVSSMGIGLDFDEGYMGGVAVAGHGNFAFVKDGAALATFLHRELEETASTTAQNVIARVRLPEGVRFVRAIGGEAHVGAGGDLEIAVGAMFAGDEQRVLVELTARVPVAQSRGFEGSVAWSVVGGDTATARFAGVSVTGSDDALAVDQGRDGAVLANAVSVLASARQIEAAAAYERGDTATARTLIEGNEHDLAAAASAAPAPAAAALMQQQAAYGETKRTFAAPASPKSHAAAKAGAARDFDNMNRKGY